MNISGSTIAALVVGGLLAIIIPIAAIIVYKRRRKDAWLISALIDIGRAHV